MSSRFGQYFALALVEWLNASWINLLKKSTSILLGPPRKSLASKMDSVNLLVSGSPEWWEKPAPTMKTVLTFRLGIAAAIVLQWRSG